MEKKKLTIDLLLKIKQMD